MTKDTMLPASVRARPRFSVLMSVYDREQPAYLDASLDSLTRSIEPITELVLVEDGPLNKGLRDVIDRYRSRLNIVSVRLPVNGGLPAALNAGLQVCAHSFVARFDSDDLNVPERFGRQLDFLATHPEVGVLGSAIEEFDAVTGAMLGARSLPTSHANLRSFAKLRSPMNHPSVMFRKEVVSRAGGYPDITYFEDYALWVQCIVDGSHLANLDEPLVKMRSGIGQMERRRGWIYVRGEFRFATTFRRAGFFSSFDALLFLLVRVPPRLLPAKLLLNLYAKVLRGRRQRTASRDA